MSIKSNAEQIRDETATGANTAARVGGNLVEVADDLITKATAITLNTAKVTYDAATAVAANTAKITFDSTSSSKLGNIEDNADVTDAVNVAAAGALMDLELASEADVKALDQSVVSGASPVFSITNQTLSAAALVVVPETNAQSFANGVDSALLKARGTGVTTSYVSTVAVAGTTFAQPAVSGEIYSDQGYFSITYAGATGITVATLSVDSTYVYIDNAGALQQQTSEPTREDWSRKMFTMRISVDTVAETILGFEYLNNPIGHYANSIRDLYTALIAQGVPFKGGQVITGRAGDLGFDVSAGTIMEFGGTGDINNANLLSLDAVANATYDLLTRTTIAAENQTDLVKFWDNAGTITALGSTTVVGHRLYRFSNGQFAMQYGQGNYANITLAQAGVLLEDYDLNPRLLNATFFGWWLIQETATNTGGTTLTDFREYTIGVQGGSSSVLAGCLLKGNSLSDLLDAGAARTNLGVVPTEDTNKTVLSLANPLGVYYNMASAHSNATYTVSGSIIGGFAQVLINTGTEPTVTGATKVAGSTFAASTNMYLVVNYNGNRAEFFFLEI